MSIFRARLLAYAEPLDPTFVQLTHSQLRIKHSHLSLGLEYGPLLLC